MIKRNKNLIFLIILILMTISFTFIKVRDARVLKSQYKTASVRFLKQGVTEISLNSALEKEKSRGSLTIPEITAWMRADEAQIISKPVNRSVKLTPVITYGDMSTVAPMTLVHGNYVYREDKKGCVLDTGTAYKLFGTVNAVGNTIEYQTRDYYIRGVVKSGYPMLLIQGNSDTIMYSNLELMYKDKEREEELAKEFIFQNGLGTDFTVIDGYFFSRVESSILAIPIWIFFIILAVLLVRNYWHEKAKLKLPVYVFYGIVGLLLISGYGIWLYHFAGFPFSLPEKLIPAKWSDFDYWSRQIQLIKDQVLELRYLPPNPKDVLLYDSISKVWLNFCIMSLLHMFILFYMVIFKKNLNKGISVPK